MRLATLDEGQNWLNDMSFRPFGMARWDMQLQETVISTQWRLDLTHWVANSRKFDHWNEYNDRPLQPLLFSVMIDRPRINEPGGFMVDVAERCLRALIHEGCEWIVWGASSDVVYDPHIEGEPTVRL